MKNLQTLKLNTSSIGSQAPHAAEPVTQDVEAAATPAPAPRPRPMRAAGELKKRLLTLAAVELAASLAAVGATGSVHNAIFQIAVAGLAITIAAVVAIETFAPHRRRRAATVAAPVEAAAPPRKALTKSKIVLLLIMAIGFATYFGNGGTFSSFSADTTNPSSAISSGTLTMSNDVNGYATTCYSYGAGSTNNVQPNCDKLFTLAGTAPSKQAIDIAPSYYAAVSKLVVENTGSIDATKLQLFAPSQTDCVDAKSGSTGVTGAQLGTGLSFNTGSLCGSAIMYVQEVGTNHHYCWFGVNSGTSRCAAPFSLAYAGGGTVGGGTVAFTGTPNGNIASGDTIQVSQLNAATQTYNVVQCPASSTVWMGDASTSVSVGSCTVVSGSNGSFTSAATVTDYTTTNTTLNGTFATSTLSNFDTTYYTIAHPLTLYPTTGDGTINNSGYGLGLPKYDSVGHTSARTFYVGVFLPAATGSNQNTLQGLQATFGLTWHIEQ